MELPKECQIIKITNNEYKCEICGFTLDVPFRKLCMPIEPECKEPAKSVEPYKCIHTGEQLEVLDTKNCNCVGRGSHVSIHRCNLYNKDCGLLSLLKWSKRKELEDKGVINCMQCPNRFDKENPKKGV